MSGLYVIEFTVPALYLILVLYLGFKKSESDSVNGDFLLAGRKLSLPAFVATLVTTWYGGILGIGEFVFQSGIVAWVVFGLPYYFFAILYALFLSGRIRNSLHVSVPQALYQTYGRWPGLAGSLLIFIITSPAPYILTLGLVIQFFTGLNFWTSVLTGTLFSLIYVGRSGFHSVVRTDKLQFVLMFSGFLLLIWHLDQNVQSLSGIWPLLDELHRDPFGDLPWQKILVWFFIASWTFVDPGFHQRCAAARSAKTARNGILISVFFWLIFDSLTMISGLYAFLLIPESDPLLSFPNLAWSFLSPFARGIFFTGLLAIVMSTIDSYGFISAVTLGRDFLPKVSSFRFTEKAFIRIGLLITAFLALVLVFLIPSVVGLWYTIGSLFLPVLLIPVIGSYYSFFRLPSKSVLILMILTLLISLGWYLSHLISGSGQYFFDIEPFFPALILNLCATLILKVRNR